MRSAVLIVSQPELKRGVPESFQNGCSARHPTRVFLQGVFCDCRPVGEPPMPDKTTSKRQPGSFKNFKNSVDNVAFQGSSPSSSRNWLARPLLWHFCTTDYQSYLNSMGYRYFGPFTLVILRSAIPGPTGGRNRPKNLSQIELINH
jgi:hypothetical protein